MDIELIIESFNERILKLEQSINADKKNEISNQAVNDALDRIKSLCKVYEDSLYESLKVKYKTEIEEKLLIEMGKSFVLISEERIKRFVKRFLQYVDRFDN